MFKKPEDFIVEELPLYEPSQVGTHTFFAIRKRNLTTLEAINRIARDLQVQSRQFGYAGLKDKNAVTTQILSVEGVAPERVLKVQQSDIEILWAERHTHKLRVGHLRGNRFEITLRDIPQNTLSFVETIMTRLTTLGVPNRFGAQRFGNKNDSHLIGRALVKAEWERVVRYMITDETLQVDDVARRMQRELARKPVERVVSSIPHRLRKLFLSAYQAYLFNRVLKQRAPDLGTLLEGDIAVKHDNGAPFLLGMLSLSNRGRMHLRSVHRGQSSDIRCVYRLVMCSHWRHRSLLMKGFTLKTFVRWSVFGYRERVDLCECRCSYTKSLLLMVRGYASVSRCLRVDMRRWY